MNNIIEQKLQILIDDSLSVTDSEGWETDYIVQRTYTAAENCFKVLEEHCVGFANFIEINKEYLHYWKSKYTTEQLFQLYINQLPNE